MSAGAETAPPTASPSRLDRAGDAFISTEWETPGSVLAQRLGASPGLRQVFETPRSDGYLVLVCLDPGAVHTRDRVFALERQLGDLFPGLPIDVRVTLTGDTLALSARPELTALLYERA
jgi:hypothetical protein